LPLHSADTLLSDGSNPTCRNAASRSEGRQISFRAAAQRRFHRHRRLKLTGLPERLRLELAWMARWQFLDGARVSIAGYRLMAVVLTWAVERDRPVPDSLTSVDFDWFSKLYTVWFHTKHGRMPSSDGYNRMSAVFNYPRLALIARLHDGPWWALDTWHPRCDPRIPLRDREPAAYEGCSPGRAQIPWVRNAAKWMLGTMLESGTLTWGTIIGRHVLSLVRFDRWLACGVPKWA
jgi:hypothetical protein